VLTDLRVMCRDTAGKVIGKGVRLPKMTSVRFCRKTRFPVRFKCYKINRGFGFSGSVFYIRLSMSSFIYASKV